MFTPLLSELLNSPIVSSESASERSSHYEAEREVFSSARTFALISLRQIRSRSRRSSAVPLNPISVAAYNSAGACYERAHEETLGLTTL